MVLERFSKGAAATAGAGAGGFAGGFFSSPTFIILGALAVILLFFQGDIRKAFGNLGKIELPAIELPSIDIQFPSFDFDFPDISNVLGGAGESVTGFFESLQQQFDQFISGFEAPAGTSGGILPLPPDVEDIGLIEDPATECPCGSNVIQDIMGDVSQVCIPCPEAPREGDPAFIGPIFEEPPFMLPEIIIPLGDPTFQPPIELPEGFVGGGPSFEGGTIFETDVCNKSIGQIAQENGISASAAADLKFQACETSDFDFGTNTGSGFGPGDDPTVDPLVTGGATLESEEQRAACVSCQLFGLNCPICAGTI